MPADPTTKAQLDDTCTPEEIHPGFDIRDYLHGIPGLSAAAANTCMQLSLLPVGRGVVESTVDSGNVLKHPIKRGRTTFSYIAVALLGTADERRAYQDAVNGQHRQVRSGPDSPVRYNAFTPELQLWVAACLYTGIRDMHVAMRGPLSPSEEEALLLHCGRLGTTLQLRTEMWPATRAEFEAWWTLALGELSTDDETRRYLRRALWLGAWLPDPVGARFGLWYRRVSIGWLPPEVRTALGLEWTEQDQARFTVTLARMSRIDRLLPLTLRIQPVGAMLLDVRLRRLLRRPLV